MAKGYMQEYNVFLWKKLILDQSPADKVFKIGDFGDYGDEEAGIGEIIKEVGSADQGKVNMEFEAACYSRPRGITPSLIQLTEKGLDCAKITEIKIDKNIISDYDRNWKSFINDQKRNSFNLLYIDGDKKRKDEEPEKKFPPDPFCGLTESIYKKVKNDEEFSISELVDLILKLKPIIYYRFLQFKIQVNKEKLSVYLDEYLGEFINEKLTPPVGVRYYKFSEQRDNILVALQTLDEKYNQITTSFPEIAEVNNWKEDEKSHYRFYETIFALEKLKKIEIQDLQKTNIAVTVLDKISPQFKKLRSEMYEDIGEPIEIKTLDLKIENKQVIRRDGRSLRLNNTDIRIINFLYIRFCENERIFSLKKVIAARLGLSQGNIRNRISYINRGVRGLITQEKDRIDDLIKCDGSKCGYRLNPMFMIQITKKK